jgi:hypothetical protein
MDEDCMTTDLSEKKKQRALAKMFTAFPGSQACRNREERMDVYIEALSKIAAAFVEEACDYAIRGKLDTQRDYPPTAAQIHELAEELQARSRTSRTGRPKFSWEKNDGPVHNTPEQRARIIWGFKKLLADLRSGRPIDPDEATRRVFRGEDQT